MKANAFGSLARCHRSWVLAISVVSTLCALFSFAVNAHPASGIVVNPQGEVFFIHTGTGVDKIDAEGKLTCIHKVSGGGHFLALDAKGRFSTQLPRLFERITTEGIKPALLYASGGAPFVVNQDGNLYYGSGFPEGDDLTPGGLTLTRLSQDEKRTLFAPDLKRILADLNEAVTGLAVGPDGTLFVACPNAILKVKTNGAVTTFVHPVEVKDCDDVFGKHPDSPFFHPPYLRGLDVTEEETVYAAVTGCRCVVKISRKGNVETILKAEKPWTPTGVAVRDKNVFVLEYTHHDKAENWVPRVRKLWPDGKVTILADLTGDDKKLER
jgi:DNA-binding beta-propeller fold protein YncE